MDFHKYNWLKPLSSAVIISLLCATAYLGGQQVLRQSANDPQVQLSEDAARSLAFSTPAINGVVDIAASLAPYTILYSPDGQPIAGNGYLDGMLPKIPAGVFNAAAKQGQNRLTWQPRAGIRQAIVVTAAPNSKGFAVAGRSLRETEQRIDRLGDLAAIGWLLSLVVLGISLKLKKE